MKIVEQTRPDVTPLAGIRHATWAGAADGLKDVSLWRQTLEPGAASPPHSHDSDEVVLCLSGSGEVHSEGSVQRFGAGTTVMLPAGRVHQIFNVGSQPLELIAVFGRTPVATLLPQGERIELPWRT